MTNHDSSLRPAWRREGTWLLTTNVAQQLVGLGVLVWLARHVAVQSWGHYAIDAATLGLVATFGSARLDVLAMRASDAEWDAGLGRRIVGSMRSEGLLLGIVGLLLFLLLGRLELATIALVLGLVARHVTQQTRAVSERAGRYAPLARRETCAVFFGHVVAVGAVLAGAPELALYLRDGGAGLALALLVLPDLRRAGLLPEGVSLAGPRTWLQLALRSRPAWFDALSERGFDRSVVLLAGALAGERGAGLFAQARSLAFRPHQFLTPLANRLGMGWLSRMDAPAERRAAVLRIAARLLPAAVALAVLVWFAAPSLVPAVLGERWSAAGRALAWLAGFVASVTLLELAKVQLQVEARLRALVVVRLAQFAAFFVALMLVRSSPLEPVLGLSLALSFATLVAAGTAYGAIVRRG